MEFKLKCKGVLLHGEVVFVLQMELTNSMELSTTQEATSRAAIQ
jgi:hypothetical protein